MTVKELIKRLKKELPDLEVEMFAHDHNPERHDEGVGEVCSVWEETNDEGRTFVALHA